MDKPVIGDVWLVANDGKAEVWVEVDGEWRVAVKPQETRGCTVSHCVNTENAREWPLAVK